MAASHADAPGSDPDDTGAGSDPGRWDRPIRLDDVDRLLEATAHVEHLDHEALRTHRAELAVVLESLTYARAVLADDVTILRRAGTDGAASVLADIAGSLADDPEAVEGSEPAGGLGEVEIDPELFARTDALLAAHQEMAVVELSSAFDVAGSLAVIEEQLGAVSERQEAATARLGQIRAAIIRRYEEGEASAREQPA